MNYTIIDVPDMNDSISRVILSGKQYQLRFTWNDTGGYWTFGLLDSLGAPLLIGVKVVPQFPLNLFSGSEELPLGIFAALTEQDHIGRQDFVSGKAGPTSIASTVLCAGIWCEPWGRKTTTWPARRRRAGRSKMPPGRPSCST